MRVKLLVQNGQTGLRPIGTIMDVNPKTGKHWIKFGWAKKELKRKRETKELK